MKECAVTDCGREVFDKGLCQAHLIRQSRVDAEKEEKETHVVKCNGCGTPESEDIRIFKGSGLCRKCRKKPASPSPKDGRMCVDCGAELTPRARGQRCTRCRVRFNRKKHEERGTKGAPSLRGRRLKRSPDSGAGVKADIVNHPPHYNRGQIEVAAFIADQQMGFLDGNVIKYVARYRHKGQPVEDLKKARWYLDKLIVLTEAEPCK